jgi:hypothetical protein
MDVDAGLRLNIRNRSATDMLKQSQAILIETSVLLASVVGGCAQPILHCNTTCRIGEQETFLAAVIERGNGLFSPRCHGIEVSFLAGGKKIGSAVTDKLGYAIATGRIPASANTFEAQADLGGRSLRSEAQALSWQPHRTMIVCDIDGTVSQTDVYTLVVDHWDTGSLPLPEAPETLRALAERYNILFLTGRPLAWRAKTVKWLDDHGFPAAPVVLAPDMHDVEHVAQFKEQVITLVQRLYPEARIGIGNAVTDSEAYTSKGMLAIMMDDGKHRRFGAQAIPVRSWTQIRQLIDANNDILSDPERARKLLSEGGMIHHPLFPAQGNRSERSARPTTKESRAPGQSAGNK